MIAYRVQRIATMLGLLAFPLMLSVSCTSQGAKTASPAPTPTAAPSSVDPSTPDAEQQARAVYAAFVQTWAQASQAADPDNPDLARYAADPLLSLVRHNIRVLRDNGQQQLGAQTATVVSTIADLAAEPPTVTINACLDYRALRLVYRSNQSPVPGSEIGTPQVSAVVTVARYTNGQWLVNESRQGGDSC